MAGWLLFCQDLRQGFSHLHQQSDPTDCPIVLPFGSPWLILLEDDHWKFVRSVLSPAFSSGKMRAMVPMIHSCLNRLNENLSAYSKSGNSFEAKSVMGGSYHGIFFPFALPLLEAVGLTVDSKEVTDFFVTMLKETIAERRKQPSPRKDLLQLILDSSVDDLKETLVDKDVDADALKLDKLDRNNKLTDTEVIAQTLLFLIAGFETTSAALAFLAYNLAVYPECQEKLIREIDSTLNGTTPTYENVMTLPYLDMCLSETQRLYPAIRGMTRAAREPVTINGVHIPAQATVLFLGYALQHDETYWPDPEKFDPERWSPEQKAARNPYVFFPFGVGPRNCVGMRLAQMEAKMAAVAMLQKFRFIRAPETEVPLTLKKGPFVQAEYGVWLRVQPRD
ncbi:cytochrome P450 3A19-like [Liolophura sinensis]|uniref:cytochrome P450 3A19-like n=1 Tax=Liolophura sinensis TaxID=3198878 RepID=UPI003158D6D8